MVKIQENVNKCEKKLQNIFIIIIIKLLYEKQSYSVPCMVSHGNSTCADDTSNLTCIFSFL